jgi:hypothetical protein
MTSIKQQLVRAFDNTKLLLNQLQVVYIGEKISEKQYTNAHTQLYETLKVLKDITSALEIEKYNDVNQYTTKLHEKMLQIEEYRSTLIEPETLTSSINIIQEFYNWLLTHPEDPTVAALKKLVENLLNTKEEINVKEYYYLMNTVSFTPPIKEEPQTEMETDEEHVTYREEIYNYPNTSAQDNSAIQDLIEKLNHFIDIETQSFNNSLNAIIEKSSSEENRLVNIENAILQNQIPSELTGRINILKTSIDTLVKEKNTSIDVLNTSVADLLNELRQIISEQNKTTEKNRDAANVFMTLTTHLEEISRKLEEFQEKTLLSTKYYSSTILKERQNFLELIKQQNVELSQNAIKSNLNDLFDAAKKHLDNIANESKMAMDTIKEEYKQFDQLRSQTKNSLATQNKLINEMKLLLKHIKPLTTKTPQVNLRRAIRKLETSAPKTEVKIKEVPLKKRKIEDNPRVLPRKKL